MSRNGSAGNRFMQKSIKSLAGCIKNVINVDCWILNKIAPNHLKCKSVRIEIVTMHRNESVKNRRLNGLHFCPGKKFFQQLSTNEMWLKLGMVALYLLTLPHFSFADAILEEQINKLTDSVENNMETMAKNLEDSLGTSRLKNRHINDDWVS